MDENAKSVIYVSRKPENVTDSEVEVISYEKLHHIKSGDIIINSTPCGMYPKIDTCAVDSEVLGNFSTAVDLVYNPQETMFLKTGKRLGLKTVNGLYMLVAQAVAAQQIWQHREISLKTLDEIYYELVNIQQ